MVNKSNRSMMLEVDTPDVSLASGDKFLTRSVLRKVGHIQKSDDVVSMDRAPDATATHRIGGAVEGSEWARWKMVKRALWKNMAKRAICERFKIVKRVNWLANRPFGHSAVQAYLLGAEIKTRSLIQMLTTRFYKHTRLKFSCKTRGQISGLPLNLRQA